MNSKTTSSIFLLITSAIAPDHISKINPQCAESLFYIKKIGKQKI